jgi:mono/diheme cytochrome c family protein
MVVVREFGLLAVLIVLSMTPLAMATSSVGNPESGKIIFLESCQSCHGLTGKGDSDLATYLMPPPANLTSKATQAKTDAELRKTILEGRPGTTMASFYGAFEEDQLTDLIAYLRSIGS